MCPAHATNSNRMENTVKRNGLSDIHTAAENARTAVNS